MFDFKVHDKYYLLRFQQIPSANFLWAELNKTQNQSYYFFFFIFHRIKYALLVAKNWPVCWSQLWFIDITSNYIIECLRYLWAFFLRIMSE